MITATFGGFSAVAVLVPNHKAFMLEYRKRASFKEKNYDALI
jgi:hypothetical protein